MHIRACECGNYLQVADSEDAVAYYACRTEGCRQFGKRVPVPPLEFEGRARFDPKEYLRRTAIAALDPTVPTFRGECPGCKAETEAALLQYRDPDRGGYAYVGVCRKCRSEVRPSK